MSKPYDESLKKFVGANPQSFLAWLCPGTVLERILPTELQSRNIFVDFLCKGMMDDKPCLFHLEFQRNIKAGIAERLLEYNVLASREHKLRVYSYVIYLIDDGAIEESPLIWKMLNGSEILHFHYQSVPIWKVDPTEFRKPGQEGILPLIVLTAGNARPDVIEEVIQRLIAANKQNLLTTTELLASLVFKANTEHSEWLKRRFAMLRDILRETDAYQGILREGLEEGRKEGLKEGLEEGRKEGIEEGKISTLRQLFIELVQTKFPEAIPLAQTALETVKNSETLQAATIKLFDVQTIDELLHILLEMSRNTG